MRLLLIGAFPYPHHQGSQVYFQEQAIALRAAGAEVSLLTYGSELSGKNVRGRLAAEHWRAVDGFEHRTSPKWTSPTSLRSGPSWAKPLGDLGLAMTLRNAIASHQVNDAYDAILTHNVEATMIALHTLPRSRPPVLYCAHTLLENELSAYLRGPKDLESQGFFDWTDIFSATGASARTLDRVGRGIDRWIAKRVDGWISLTQSTERVMRQFSRGPGSLLPPPIPDPEQNPEALNPREVAARYGLEAGHYFIYSGNFDGYQELDILATAVAKLAARSHAPPPVVAVSHRGIEEMDPPRGRGGRRVESMPGVEFRSVESAAEMQALLSAARASLVTRRAKGGFPIKLVNSLSVGTPIIAFHEQEWGLTHERDSLICPSGRAGLALADSIERLTSDEALTERLASGARALYLERHRPGKIAFETLALIEKVRSSRAR